MLIIALTGGIACGKSTVSGMLHTLGASIIDADEISRSLTAEGGAALPLIRETFGDQVFHADGTLNRPALSKAVFGNPDNLAKLNAITHEQVNAVVREILSGECSAALVGRGADDLDMSAFGL